MILPELLGERHLMRFGLSVYWDILTSLIQPCCNSMAVIAEMSELAARTKWHPSHLGLITPLKT